MHVGSHAGTAGTSPSGSTIVVTTLEPSARRAGQPVRRARARPRSQRPTPRARARRGPGPAHRPRHQAVHRRPQEEARHRPWTTSRIRIERGEIYGILGANGGGKSTLIRLVSTLLTLDTGRVEVFGHDIERDEMAVKRLINRVSVDAAFFKKLSPYENLIYAARLYGLDAGTARGGTPWPSWPGWASPSRASVGRWSR